MNHEDSAHKRRGHTPKRSKITFELLKQQMESNQRHLMNVGSEELLACGEEMDKVKDISVSQQISSFTVR